MLQSWDELERLAPRGELSQPQSKGREALKEMMAAMRKQVQECPIRGYVLVDRPDKPETLGGESQEVEICFHNGDPREGRIRVWV